MAFDMKTLKLLLLLALVFAAGAVAGVVGTRAVVRRVVSEALVHPERIQTVIERHLTRQLRLDAEQRLKLRQILSNTHGRLQDLRRDYQPQLTGILSNANEQITIMLTPEQQARFERLKEQRHPLLRVLERGP